MPIWVKEAMDRWLTAASVTTGRVFKAVSRHGTEWGIGISENVVWYAVRSCARRRELDYLALHDLRRTCAKLCHVNGGELESIQFLLGHGSVLTTERYLGCKQNLEGPVNDRISRLFSEGAICDMACSRPIRALRRIRFRRSGLRSARRECWIGLSHAVLDRASTQRSRRPAG